MATPLALDFTYRAYAEANSIVEWLDGYQREYANRFTDALERETAAACQVFANHLAAGRPIGPEDETGSLAFSRPVFTRLFTTAKVRRRNNAAGTYRVYYALADSDGDGKADTLQVLAVRHAAARPLWDISTYDFDPNESF